MKISKESDHKCTVCPKSFSYEKALHGHMRLHPKRPWRGMKPPSPPAASATLPPLPRWTLTAKRGRMTTISTSSSSTSGTSSTAGSELAGNDSTTLVLHQNSTELYEKSATKKIKIKLKNLNHSKKQYRCYSCDKEFSSPQALGGHKSNRNKLTMVVSSSNTDDQQQQSTQGRQVFDFDLNETPTIDEDHEATQFTLNYNMVVYYVIEPLLP